MLSRVAGLYSYQMMFIIKQIITTSILLSLPSQFVVGSTRRNYNFFYLPHKLLTWMSWNNSLMQQRKTSLLPITTIWDFAVVCQPGASAAQSTLPLRFAYAPLRSRVSWAASAPGFQTPARLILSLMRIPCLRQVMRISDNMPFCPADRRAYY